MASKQDSGIQNPSIPDKKVEPAPIVAVQKEVDNKPLTPLQDDNAPKTPMQERTTAVSDPPAPEKKIASIRQPEPIQRPPAAPQTEKAEITKTSILVIKNEPEETIKRENWLRVQNPSQYTIQLIGVRSETTLLRFIAENSSVLSNRQLAYYRSVFKSEDWFPMLYGLYASRSEAKSALENLPENIRKGSPWIRKISAVQNDIKRRNKKP